MTKYIIYQGDEFTPAFKISSFDTREEADAELKKTQEESIVHDMFTCFWVKEEDVK